MGIRPYQGGSITHGNRVSELVPAVPADSELISETESGEVQCESGMNEGEPRYTSE